MHTKKMVEFENLQYHVKKKKKKLPTCTALGYQDS